MSQKEIVIVGGSGRMSQMLQTLCEEKKRNFRVLKSSEPNSFEGCLGVIDFSVPEAAKVIAKAAADAKVPLVCGTTGWESENQRDAAFASASQIIPVLWDSNFSVGIEILCRAAEELSTSPATEAFITDIHHQHKKDSPSGTALKLADRMQAQNPEMSLHFRDFRTGEIAGEHRVLVSWADETLEFTHRATSRRCFAEGAIRCLDWLANKKPGFYRMKDTFQ